MSEVTKEEGPISFPGNGHRPSLEGDHDPHFEPIITLPEVKVPTLEEEETVLHKVRAKLFRHDKVNREWKERGTGEAKLLYHETKKTVRIIMRRDKTLKLCANHYVTKDMKLEPKIGADRVWLWTTPADMSDGEPNAEILAMRFMNPDAANNWRSAFDDAKKLIPEDSNKLKDTDDEEEEGVASPASSDSGGEEDDWEVVNKVSSLSIQEQQSAVNQEEDQKEDSLENKEEIQAKKTD